MTADFETRFPENASQAEYWNTVASDTWIAHQSTIDARLAPLIDLLLERSRPAAGERAVDVGCGSGAMLLRLAERVGPRGRALGIDISARLIELAAARVAAAGHVDRIELRQVDAQTHPFEPASQDLVVSRFGVMFFAHPVAAFRNLRRCLRTGGRLTFVAWAALEANPWFAAPLEAAIAFVGPPDPTPPRAPGPLAFGDPAYVDEILTGAGFAEVTVEPVKVILPGAATAADEAEMVCQIGPVSRLLRQRDPDAATRARIVAAITDALEPFQTAAGMRIPATVHGASAIRP